MTQGNQRSLAGFVLLAIWIGLRVFDVNGADQIIDAIKYALALLFGYHAGDRGSAQPQ